MRGFKNHSLHMLVLDEVLGCKFSNFSRQLKLNLGNAEKKSVEFVNRECQVTLEVFWTQKVQAEEGFDRTDSMLEELGAGWTASILAKIYPSLSRYLTKEFLQAVVEVSIVELIALFVTIGAENVVRGPAILLTEGVQNLGLNGLLTLMAITHGNLGGLMNLAGYPVGSAS